MTHRPIPTLTATDLPHICNTLASIDPDLAAIIQTYGYPPFWDRPNTFESLVHIILEQQVSLASALAALEKLRARLDTITPKSILSIPNGEFTPLYVSRQKKVYLQRLAQEIVSGELNLEVLATLPDDAIRSRLTRLKGIGNWTADIYLIMVLHRLDVFPFGDIAAVSSLRQIKHLQPEATTQNLQEITETWRPYRSVAAYILWHNYLSVRNRVVPA